MAGKISVAVFNVGENPALKTIPNTLEALHEIVGGYIEMTRLPYHDDLIIICNEEGKLEGLKPQLDIGNDVICGNFLIARDNKDGEITSLTEVDKQTITHLLKIKFK